MMEAVKTQRRNELLVELHKERQQDGRARSSEGKERRSVIVNGEDATIHQQEKRKE
jgi:hypothetical protein